MGYYSQSVLDIPHGTSPQAIELIRACIQFKALDRLNLAQIKQHQFFQTETGTGGTTSGTGGYFLEDVENRDADTLEYFQKKRLKEIHTIAEEQDEGGSSSAASVLNKTSVLRNEEHEDARGTTTGERRPPLEPGSAARSSGRGRRSTSTVPPPDETFRYFQRNPDLKRPILPLTWHILRHLRNGDEEMIVRLKKCKYVCKKSQVFAERFLQIDQWEREARPGQGPNAKVQAFLDAEMNKKNPDETDSSSKESDEEDDEDEQKEDGGGDDEDEQKEDGGGDDEDEQKEDGGGDKEEGTPASSSLPAGADGGGNDDEDVLEEPLVEVVHEGV